MNDLVETQLYIDGRAQCAAGERTYPLYNPARPEELVGHAARAATSDVDLAAQAAHRALPGWSALSYAERGSYLQQIAKALVADANDVAFRSRLFCREHGKILKETMMEMSRLGDRFEVTASYGARLAQDDCLNGPPFDTIITKQPFGVVALIVPWNWPLSILGAKLPQALMAGNTVVVKPAQNSAMAPTMTLHKIAALLPKGVLNVVTGQSSDIGDALVGHRLVRRVNFTGSIEVGRHVMRIAAENITPVTLELGGNDAGLVLEDAKLDEQAFLRMYLGAFMSTGQICMALKRLYVHRSRYDEVVQGLSTICARQVIGDGLLPETTMGPLNNKKQLGVVRAMIKEARAAGAEVKEFGSVPDPHTFERGYFQRPTLVFDPDEKLSVVREEQFGPVLPILPFDTDDEAIDRANGTEFGLCSSVWSEDRERALRIARRLEAGYTYLNGHGPASQDSRAPFGGFKQSGIGRNLGYEGVTEFLGHHSISAPMGWLHG